MFTLSASSIILILVVAFYCRKTLKTIGDKVPQSIEKSVVHLDDIITTNILENECELKARSKDAFEMLKTLGDINISEMYSTLHPTKKPTIAATA